MIKRLFGLDLNKIIVLITTGMPGFTRLILFILIEFLMGIQYLGEFSNDL